MNSFSENILQEANTKNQVYQNTCKSMHSFLQNLPTNQINSNDDLSQVAAKQNSQEVRLSIDHSLTLYPTRMLIFLVRQSFKEYL